MAAPDLPTRTAQALGRLGRAAALGPPPLIEGEDGAAYNQLFAGIVAAVKPKDFIEEILVSDVANLSWEVRRLRHIRAKFLTSQVALQIRDYLNNPCGASQAQKLSAEWEAGDSRVIARVDELLAASGSPTVESMTAHVFVVRIEYLERIDRMITSAEARRNVALREVDRHRSTLGQALRHASEEAVDAEFEDVALNRRTQKDAA